MRQDEIMQIVFDLVKQNQINEANNFVLNHYPKSKSQKPLVEEVAKLGFNAQPKFIEAKSELSIKTKRKSFSEVELDNIFSNDYYHCQYSGIKLFARPVLTILSLYLNDSFMSYKIPHYPLDKNHQGTWTLYPSPDHVQSIVTGGSNKLDNLVTASSSLNMIKGQYNHKEMGWELIDKNSLDKNWGGGKFWFLKFVHENKNEMIKLMNKSIELGTFKTNNPQKYFGKWIKAFVKTSNSGKIKLIDYKYILNY